METTSRFASKLRTNYAATKEEAAELTAFLAGPISELADLRDEINRTKARYHKLVERHAELANEISRHQAFMAPVRRLPVDVIREIFINCLPTTHNAVISARECPILLTRICSGWRSIALSTAVLWASIHVPIPSDVDSGRPMPGKQYELAIATAKRRAEAIKEWLSRSGECVLSISLHNQQHETSAVVYDIILDALIPFCRRWGALKCDTPTLRLVRIAEIPDGDLPQLHTLYINGGTFEQNVLLKDESQRIVRSWIDSGVVRAPLLRTISCNNMTENFARFPLRRGQLTSLTIHGGALFATESMSLQSLAGLLATCPLLHDCCLHIASPHYLDNQVECTGMPIFIELHHLQELAIHWDHLNLSLLLDLLDVPMLSKLDIDTGLFIAPALHALIRRSAHTLRTLSLTSNIFKREEFFACMRTCEDLTELTLRVGIYSGNILLYSPSLTQTQHLSGTDSDTTLPDEAVMTPLVLDEAFLREVLAHVPEAGPVILPRLTVFACHMSGAFSDTGVVDAICARRAAAALGKVAALRKVDIIFGRPQQQSMAHAIKELEEVGVKCTLSYTASFRLGRSTATDGISGFVRSRWEAPVF